MEFARSRAKAGSSPCSISSWRNGQWAASSPMNMTRGGETSLPTLRFCFIVGTIGEFDIAHQTLRRIRPEGRVTVV